MAEVTSNDAEYKEGVDEKIDPKAAILEIRQRKTDLLSTAKSIIAGSTDLETAKASGFKPLRFFEESSFSPEELQMLVEAGLHPANDAFYGDGVESELEPDLLAARLQDTQASLNKAAIIERLKSDVSNPQD